MLTPALRQLFVELEKFNSDQRSIFENDLHSELLAVAGILAASQRVMTTTGHGLGATMAGTLPIAFAREAIEASPILKTYIDLGSGPVSTTVNTKCSKSDCPNKRIK